jgi:hypothetical protein
VLTDNHGEYKWQYGKKIKDKTLRMSKRWFAEIKDLRTKYPLLMLVRDNTFVCYHNSGENTLRSGMTSSLIWDSIMGVKNYFQVSTSYEQWQNGLAESYVDSVTMLGKTAMAESGLWGPYWFCKINNCVNCR